MSEKKDAEFSPIGFALGLPIGMSIAMAFDNIALFPVFGCSIGVLPALAMRSQDKEE